MPTKRKPVPTKPAKRKPDKPGPRGPVKARPARYVTVVTRAGDRVRDTRTGRFVARGRKRPVRVVSGRVLQGDMMRRTATTAGRFFRGKKTAALERVNFWSALSAAKDGGRLGYIRGGKVYSIDKGSEGFFIDRLRDIFDRYLKAAKATAKGSAGGSGGKEPSFPQLLIEQIVSDRGTLFNLDSLRVDEELMELTGDIEQIEDMEQELNEGLIGQFDE